MSMSRFKTSGSVTFSELRVAFLERSSGAISLSELTAGTADNDTFAYHEANRHSSVTGIRVNPDVKVDAVPNADINVSDYYGAVDDRATQNVSVFYNFDYPSDAGTTHTSRDVDMQTTVDYNAQTYKQIYEATVHGVNDQDSYNAGNAHIPETDSYVAFSNQTYEAAKLHSDAADTNRFTFKYVVRQQLTDHNTDHNTSINRTTNRGTGHSHGDNHPNWGGRHHQGHRNHNTAYNTVVNHNTSRNTTRNTSYTVEGNRKVEVKHIRYIDY